MFTPPPSPRPLSLKHTAPVQVNTSAATLSPPSLPNAMPSHDRKRQTGRRFRWAVLIVPLVLILITASTQYLTHPAVFDVFSPASSKEWSHLLAQTKDWRLHKRHPTPQLDEFNNEPASSSAALSSAAAPTPSTAPSPAVVPQPTPTKPSAPPTLPTPFPQPFDPQLTLNFSSTSCLGFFTNMTQSAAFRPCRPFSLLSQSSADFISAQSNLTLMNTLIWGTCNINPGVNQCIANMGWFASTLKTACADDLKDRNAMAVDTLTALNAYELMYNVACSSDPITNTYCYISAVSNTNPADLYLYQLPLGISLPPSANGLTCSSCSKTILGFYAGALDNSTVASDLTGLKAAYEPSVQIVKSACGSQFAQSGIVNGATSVHFSYGFNFGGILVVLGFWSLVF